jgi:2-oxoglutarate dehydrogenase E2 component (dihydrolipoamide succinyltransferase)
MADIIEMKMPSPGESITEVEVAQLLVSNGDIVNLDDPIAEIDSDKATLELNAEAAGKIEFLVGEGDTVEVGQIVCKIDTSFKPEPKADAPAAKAEEAPKKEAAPAKEVTKSASVDNSGAKATPLAKAIMDDKGVAASKVSGSGNAGKILRRDVETYLTGGFETAAEMQGWGGSRRTSCYREK